MTRARSLWHSRGVTRRPGRLLLLALLSSAISLPVVVVAQDRGAGAREEAAVLEGEPDEALEDQDVDSDVRTEAGEKVKVFRFSGLDLAGRLKSPQLLYFLNRMRAEFDRPRLPHRSFIPELQRSSHGKALR